MDAFDDFLVYQKIWERARELEVTVCYSPDPGEPAMRGYFTPQEAHYNKNEAMPEISITRLGASGCEPNRGDLTPEQLRRELFTLAHEYGHFMSWKRSKDAGGAQRDKWEQYHAAAKERDEIMKLHRRGRAGLQRELGIKDRLEHIRLQGQRIQAKLKPEELNLIIEEEELAWKLGRDTLVDFGFKDLKPYDGLTKQGVHKHKVMLGIDEVEADDGLAELDNE